MKVTTCDATCTRTCAFQAPAPTHYPSGAGAGPRRAAAAGRGVGARLLEGGEGGAVVGREEQGASGGGLGLGEAAQLLVAAAEPEGPVGDLYEGRAVTRPARSPLYGETHRAPAKRSAECQPALVSTEGSSAASSAKSPTASAARPMVLRTAAALLRGAR